MKNQDCLIHVHGEDRPSGELGIGTWGPLWLIKKAQCGETGVKR